MIVVRLEDGTTVFGFAARALVARRAEGVLDTFWDRAAVAVVAEHSGDVHRGLASLPGARVIYDGSVADVASPLQLTGRELGHASVGLRR